MSNNAIVSNYFSKFYCFSSKNARVLLVHITEAAEWRDAEN